MTFYINHLRKTYKSMSISMILIGCSKLAIILREKFKVRKKMMDDLAKKKKKKKFVFKLVDYYNNLERWLIHLF
jgi:hypothetical protein